MTLALPNPPRAPAEEIVCYLHLVVPGCFRGAVDRHHRHLVDLARRLQAAHIPLHDITTHLDRLVDSYRTQLLSAIDAQVKG